MGPGRLRQEGSLSYVCARGRGRGSRSLFPPLEFASPLPSSFPPSILPLPGQGHNAESILPAGPGLSQLDKAAQLLAARAAERRPVLRACECVPLEFASANFQAGERSIQVQGPALHLSSSRRAAPAGPL